MFKKRVTRSFAVAWKELETAYRKVRKLAKIKFDSQPEVVARLNLKGKVPQLYVPFMATVETLVSGVTADQSLLDQLKPLQISEYTIYDLEQGIRKTKELRTEYLHKKSETQRITAEKQKAIAELFCWCSNYIKMARIAMADTPQLLEALGIVVKR